MDVWFVALAGLAGLLFGSFATVAIHRWPAGLTVSTPKRSRCPACESTLAWYDNIPVVSWAVLRGRCRDCRAQISWRYPAVELSMAVLFAVSAGVWGLRPLLLAVMVVVWACVVATMIDVEHRIIPNRMTLPLPVILVALLAFDAAVQGDSWPLVRGVIVGVALPAGLLAIAELFRVLRGQVGMGMGDIKFSASLGLVTGYVGWAHAVAFAYGAVLLGALVGVALIVTRRAAAASRIPFGPYLAVSTVVVLLSDVPADALRAIFVR